jgi:hypothetical protein
MDDTNKKLAHKIGFLGLIPFCLLSLLCWVVHSGWLPYFIRAQLYYGIAILSFLGGLHWGVAMMAKNVAPEDIRRALLWGVIPTIFAWCSMVNVGLAFAVQIVGFVVLYKVDKKMYAIYDLPEWFATLRYKLTRVVVGAMVFTFLAVNVRNIWSI